MSFLSFLFGPADGGPLPYADDSPEGLAARWVRWAAASNVETNPIADQSGRYASVNQPEDVWFLAGCFGGDVERTCRVPLHRKLFFPVINIWSLGGTAPPRLPKATGQLRIDGAEIPLDTIVTPQSFLVKGSRRNPVTGTRSRVPTYVWGLWKLVDPLPPGKHTVHFSGGDGEQFKLNIVYHLTVSQA